MRIRALGLHLTDRCTARCEHCAYHCGPHVGGVMKLSEAKEHLAHALTQGADMCCISGGEPLLYFGVATKIVQEAKKLGIGSIWVFTNAFWAIDLEATKKKLERLQAAGVTRLCLSADGFHQPFIPTVRVRHAIEAAECLGMEIVVDTRIMGKSLQEDNPVNKATVNILQELGDLRNIETWRGSPLCIGRAAEILPQKLGLEPIFLGGPCGGPWAGGSWTNPVGVDVDQYGEVTLCPGISIGNTRRRSLGSIISEYEPSQHRIIRDLSAGGPEGLWRNALDLGYRSLVGYLTACHLCYDVRKFLRRKYPADLAPSICYEEVA